MPHSFDFPRHQVTRNPTFPKKEKGIRTEIIFKPLTIYNEKSSMQNIIFKIGDFFLSHRVLQTRIFSLEREFDFCF